MMLDDGGKCSWEKSLKKGSNAKQLILRDVVVEVVEFHSLPPTFWTGMGVSQKPVVAVEIRNLQKELPWSFRAEWISESSKSPFRPLHGQQVEVDKPVWDSFALQILALDRGIHKFNIFVTVRQDNDPELTFKINARPITVAFFEIAPEGHPDYESLRKRYLGNGGAKQRMFPRIARPHAPGLGTCPF